MQFLNRLKLWQKLALLVVAMAVPTALLGFFYLSGANTQVALASDEIELFKNGDTVMVFEGIVSGHHRVFVDFVSKDKPHEPGSNNP